MQAPAVHVEVVSSSTASNSLANTIIEDDCNAPLPSIATLNSEAGAGANNAAANAATAEEVYASATVTTSGDTLGQTGAQPTADIEAPTEAEPAGAMPVAEFAVEPGAEFRAEPGAHPPGAEAGSAVVSMEALEAEAAQTDNAGRPSGEPMRMRSQRWDTHADIHTTHARGYAYALACTHTMQVMQL